MYCISCGANLPQGAAFCTVCGARQNPPSGQPSAPQQQAQPFAQQPAQQAPAQQAPSGVLRGFSPRINDPAFARYVKKSNRWAAVFSVVVAVAAVVGFYIAGETGSDMENPQSLYIGLGVGAMFLLIALFQIAGRNRGKTWDGTVEDKKVQKKTDRQTYNDGDVRYETYLEYRVVIRSDQGKRYVLRARNDDTLFNYYRIGDRVRRHGGLNSYEKYDKTGDRFIPCNACGTLCDIREDYCPRCRCPLLK